MVAPGLGAKVVEGDVDIIGICPYTRVEVLEVVGSISYEEIGMDGAGYEDVLLSDEGPRLTLLEDDVFAPTGFVDGKKFTSSTAVSSATNNNRIRPMN